MEKELIELIELIVKHYPEAKGREGTDFKFFNAKVLAKKERPDLAKEIDLLNDKSLIENNLK